MSGPGSYLGIPVEFHRTIGSTNDELMRRADQGAPEGLILATDEQTSGRGRHGRVWWDAPGRSLLFSLLLRPTIPLPRYPLLGMAMACAVAEADASAAVAQQVVRARSRACLKFDQPFGTCPGEREASSL